MKSANYILAIILSAVMAGCGKVKHSTEDLITVDVTKSYPKKELILQDFLDVEYIPLDDTNDDLLTNGIVSDIGKEVILVRNMGMTGDILVFDRNGTGLRKINRKGQGAQEYASFVRAILDETNNEMYVYGGNTIVIYDLFGTFKQKFVFDGMFFTMVANFDSDHFICNESIEFENEKFNRFWVISKRDGSVKKEIQIPYKEKKRRTIVDKNASPSGFADGPRNQELIPNRFSWILTEISSDTIYQLTSDYRMIPLIVRTPSVQSMIPEVFLFPSVLTDSYYFMQTAEKTAIRTETGNIYPRRNLVYDIKKKAIFEYIVYNDDFSSNRPVSLAFESSYSMPFISNEIAFVYKLESYELVEAYGKGQLKGKLKEIAAKLNEESNPVILVAKHKK